MHVLQRTLNRLNLLTDYQVAAALIGLPTEITTDIFTYFIAPKPPLQCRSKNTGVDKLVTMVEGNNDVSSIMCTNVRHFSAFLEKVFDMTDDRDCDHDCDR